MGTVFTWVTVFASPLPPQEVKPSDVAPKTTRTRARHPTLGDLLGAARASGLEQPTMEPARRWDKTCSRTLVLASCARARFRRALEIGNLPPVRAAAADLPRDPSRWCAPHLGSAAGDPSRYERAVIRWLGATLPRPPRAGTGIADSGDDGRKRSGKYRDRMHGRRWSASGRAGGLGHAPIRVPSPTRLRYRRRSRLRSGGPVFRL